MSINEQVKELRIAGGTCIGMGKELIARFLLEAADTIEALSAKLQTAKMDRTAEGCGGWIKCKVRVPEEGQEVILQDYYGNREIGRFGHNEDYQEGFYIGDWFSTSNNYLAWHESPEPYHEP